MVEALRPGLPPASIKERAEDPRTYFARLRSQGRLIRDHGEINFLDGSAIERVLHDPFTFSSSGAVFYGRKTPIVPQHSDPPLHVKYRRILTPLMTVKRVAVLEAFLVEETNRRIDFFIDRGGCHLRADLAQPVPALALLKLMNLPVSDLTFLLAYKDAILRPRSFASSLEEQERHQLEMARQCDDYFRDVIRERRIHPGEDLISAIIRSEVDGERMNDEEILSMCGGLPLAGLDTVTSTLLLSYAFLARNDEYQELMSQHPESIKMMVEELLRWETPVHAAKRLVNTDVEINGCPFHAGDRILVSLSSANSDENRIPHAGTFEPARQPNRHVTFGTGPHTCIGNHLARLELRTVLTEWHRRIPRYALTPGSQLNYSDENVIRTIEEVELQWS